MKWTDEQTASIEEAFASFPPDRQNVIDARALMLFCNLHLVDLAPEKLPGTAPELNREELAQFRQLVLCSEPVFLLPTIADKPPNAQ